ncbi:MAG TPA: nucleoside monophosphate kinase [Candidatus Paceibacterota bacterium]
MTLSRDFKTLVVLGKSGSGKGTQVEMLARDYNFRIISSGTLLRSRAAQRDFVGKRIGEIINKGGLVPTPVIFHLWLHELEATREDGSARGVVFEGSPRKLYEAWMLDETLWFYGLDQNMLVIHLDISDQEAMKRLLARGRKDDQPEAIQERLRWYQEQVSPAIEYYREKGKLIEINGEQPIEEVSKEVLEKLKDFLA